MQQKENSFKYFKLFAEPSYFMAQDNCLLSIYIENKGFLNKSDCLNKKCFPLV